MAWQKNTSDYENENLLLRVLDIQGYELEKEYDLRYIIHILNSVYNISLIGQLEQGSEVTKIGMRFR